MEEVEHNVSDPSSSIQVIINYSIVTPSLRMNGGENCFICGEYVLASALLCEGQVIATQNLEIQLKSEFFCKMFFDTLIYFFCVCYK